MLRRGKGGRAALGALVVARGWAGSDGFFGYRSGARDARCACPYGDGVLLAALVVARGAEPPLIRLGVAPPTNALAPIRLEVGDEDARGGHPCPLDVRETVTREVCETTRVGASPPTSRAGFPIRFQRSHGLHHAAGLPCRRLTGWGGSRTLSPPGGSMPRSLARSVHRRTVRGRSSVVERHVANVKVEGSSPFARFATARP